MKVIIAGSRVYTDLWAVEEAVYQSDYPLTEIVSGTANGIDKLGEEYAAKFNIPVKQFPADWSKGKSAGIQRNIQMAEYADALIAIWDGKSKGTLHMICDMVAKQKPVFVYCPR